MWGQVRDLQGLVSNGQRSVWVIMVSDFQADAVKPADGTCERFCVGNRARYLSAVMRPI